MEATAYRGIRRGGSWRDRLVFGAVLLVGMAAGAVGTDPARARLENESKPPPSIAGIVEVPREPPPLFRWDVPGALEQIPINGETVAMGLPTKMHAVRSSKSVEELKRHFNDAFRKAQLYIPPPERVQVPMREESVTALDPVRLLSFMAIFQQNPDRSVTVILTETNLSQPRQVKAFAPVYPGGRPLTSTTEGLKSLIYAVTADEADVSAFYRRELTKQGFVEVEPFKFQKGRTVWWVTVSQSGGETTVSVIDSAQVPLTSPPQAN